MWRESGALKFGAKTALTAADGVVYAAEPDNGLIYAVDAKNGRTRWTFHDATATKNLTWSIAADGTRAYVAYGSAVRAIEA